MKPTHTIRAILIMFVALCILLPQLKSSNAQSPRVVEILVQGSPLRGTPNGIAFDSQNRLWIASAMASTLTAIDPETGEILVQWGREQGISFPDDLTFDAEDNLYYTDPVTGRVTRLTPDREATVLAENLPGANPITLAEDGRLFFAQCFGASTGIFEINPQTLVEPRLILGEQPGCATNAMDIGPDGFLYGPRWFEGQIVKFDIETGEMTPVLTDLGVPSAVKFDSQGRLHALDAESGEVWRVDLSTGNAEVIATLPEGLDNLAFNKEDRLFVSVYADGSIVEVLADGSYRTVLGSGMVTSSGVAIHDGVVYTGGFYGLSGFDAETGELVERVINHFQISAIQSPLTIASDGENLLLTSWLNNSVRVWNIEAGEATAEYTDIAVPINAIRFQGDLVVAEIGSGQVVRLDIDNPNNRESLMIGIPLPAGLAASDDDLWVGDLGTGNIWQVVADGEKLEEPLLVASGLQSPEGMAITPDGHLVIVEAGLDRLVALDPASGKLTTIAEGLKLSEAPYQFLPLPPSLWFDAVDVDSSGTIFVNADLANVIYRIR